jgi:hypothetical protein
MRMMGFHDGSPGIFRDLWGDSIKDLRFQKGLGTGREFGREWLVDMGKGKMADGKGQRLKSFVVRGSSFLVRISELGVH